MKAAIEPNAATLSLNTGETVFLRPSVLMAGTSFDWCLMPPYPLGSPIARMLHGCYFAMKRVEAGPSERHVRVNGSCPRGNFLALDIPAGQRVYVSAHMLAGFTNTFKDLHTHIKLSPLYWCVNKHFFPVFEGPGTVLLYSGSPLQETDAMEHQSEAVVAFDIDRRFTAAAPQPTRLTSQLVNVFSRSVTWQFVDAGSCIVENRTYEEDGQPQRHGLLKFLGHVLGFFRI